MQAVAVTFTMQVFAHHHFGLCVFAFNAAHIVRAGFSVVHIGHGVKVHTPGPSGKHTCNCTEENDTPLTPLSHPWAFAQRGVWVDTPQTSLSYANAIVQKGIQIQGIDRDSNTTNYSVILSLFSS